MENKNEKPKVFTVLKIVAILLLICRATLITLAFTAFYDEVLGMDPICFAIGMAAIFFSIPCFLFGVLPQIQRTSIKVTRYLQEDAEDDLRHIANKTADIASGAVKKTTKAIKNALKDTMYCKHCGAEIDTDSTFCKMCGKQQ